MHVRLTVLAIAVMIPAASPAAQAPQTPTAPDPNEKICENLSQIGSRLSKKRICATRAECRWFFSIASMWTGPTDGCRTARTLKRSSKR